MGAGAAGYAGSWMTSDAHAKWIRGVSIVDDRTVVFTYEPPSDLPAGDYEVRVAMGDSETCIDARRGDGTITLR